MSALAPSRRASSSARRLGSSPSPLPNVIGAIIAGRRARETDANSQSPSRTRRARGAPLELVGVGVYTQPAERGGQRGEVAAQQRQPVARGSHLDRLRHVDEPDATVVP